MEPRSPSRIEIASVPEAAWSALAARFRELELHRVHGRVWVLGEVAFPPASRVLAVHMLRKEANAAARLLRMFRFGDAIDREEAVEALGAGLFEDLVRGRVLQETSLGVVSALFLENHDGRLFFAEELSHGGDAVMGIGPLTPLLARAAQPSGTERRGTLLDLGCGAGCLTLALAGRFEEVVATDVNPRATAVCGANAILAGLGNVRTLTGDLFEPVAERRFDRIVCQPPFIADYAGKRSTFGTGGERGDELALRAMAAAPEHLTERGLALFALGWALTDERTVESRVREVLPGANVLVIDAGDTNVDALTVGNAMFADPSLGEAFRAELSARYEHFERLGARSLKSTFIAITRPSGSRSPWSATFEMNDAPIAELHGRDVEAWVRAHDMAASGQEAIMRASFAVRPDLQLARFSDGSALVVNPAETPLPKLTIGPTAADMVDRVRKAKTGTDILRRHAKDTRTPANLAARHVTQAIEALLQRGIVEVA